jgi:hypothetical protein
MRKFNLGKSCPPSGTKREFTKCAGKRGNFVPWTARHGGAPTKMALFRFRHWAFYLNSNTITPNAGIVILAGLTAAEAALGAAASNFPLFGFSL